MLVKGARLLTLTTTREWLKQQQQQGKMENMTSINHLVRFRVSLQVNLVFNGDNSNFNTLITLFSLDTIRHTNIYCRLLAFPPINPLKRAFAGHNPFAILPFCWFVRARPPVVDWRPIGMMWVYSQPTSASLQKPYITTPCSVQITRSKLGFRPRHFPRTPDY